MKFPWVSRELYERALDDLRKSELERKELLNKLLGAPSAESVEQFTSALTQTAVEDPEKLVPPAMSPDTPSGLRKMAQSAAYKRAGMAG